MINWLIVLGLVAGTLTTFAGIPQLIKIWKTKETEDISLGMYAMVFVGVILWFIYGILTGDLPLIAANSIGLLLVSSILILKLIYDKK